MCRITASSFIYKEEKYQINVGSVSGLADWAFVLSHSNAISVICLYVVRFKTSDIKQALLP